MDRREFLKRAFAAAVGFAAADKSGVLTTAKKVVDGLLDPRLESSINEEIQKLRPLIEQGISTAEGMKRIIEEQRRMIVERDQLVEDSQEWTHLNDKVGELSKQFNVVDWYTIGDHLSAPLVAANPMAQEVLNTPQALENLALLRLNWPGYAPGSRRYEWNYQHNHAAGYRELGRYSRAEFLERLELFKKGCKDNTIDTRFLSPEDVLYCLADERFDFSLDDQKFQSFLDTTAHDWQTTPAQNTKYTANNTGENFSVFDRNRMSRVIEQFKNPLFRKSLFADRDDDLKDTDTEHGGVIPFFRDKRGLVVLPPEKRRDNETYVVPPSRSVAAVSSPAAYHLHATQMTEEVQYAGPSQPDSGTPILEVVFTSLGADQMLGHAFVSRYDPNTMHYTAMSVMSLGYVYQKDGLH